MADVDRVRSWAGTAYGGLAVVRLMFDDSSLLQRAYLASWPTRANATAKVTCASG